jgi:phosphopantothenoylcysteine decarboxylase/phosphopantothenate--cysteine ligase
MLTGKKILLIITGGIAAFKSIDVIRQINKQGGAVTVILTRAAQEFVTPLTIAGVSGEKVFTDLFDLSDETEIGHIERSRAADLVVVVPATADIMSCMANGQAHDLATTVLLATDKPVMIAPAMNVRMWHHPATQRNLTTLRRDGVTIIGPDEGDMACGEFGLGRMSEPDVIVAAISAHFDNDLKLLGGKKLLTGKKPLEGKKVLITAGPTHEPIDPVRYIANRSSGKQGYAIARSAFELGARVILVSGPTNLPVPEGMEVIPVETAMEMLAACEMEMPADIAIFAAAVADWRVVSPADKKMKKTSKKDVPDLHLTQNPDILSTIAHSKKDRPELVVGFAAETNDVIKNARKKLKSKACDLIVANDVSAASGVMGGANNTVHLVSTSGVQDWPQMPKQQVADRLMAHLAEMLDKNK